MKPSRLSEWVDDMEDKDTELHAALRESVARAESISGRRFDDVKIASVAEMGEAAGECMMCNGAIRVREDMVSSISAVRQDLTHVLSHEAEHAQGDGLEGVTELVTSMKTGHPPVPAYREKVEHAKHIEDALGREELLRLSRTPDGKRCLFEAYSEKKITQSRVQTAAQVDSVYAEAAEDVARAA